MAVLAFLPSRRRHLTTFNNAFADSRRLEAEETNSKSAQYKTLLSLMFAS